jgi:hypothetical protein
VKPLTTGRSGEQGSFEPTHKWKMVNGSMSNESNCGRLEPALPNMRLNLKVARGRRSGPTLIMRLLFERDSDVTAISGRDAALL